MDFESLEMLLDELHSALGETVLELESTLQGIATEIARKFAEKDVIDDADYAENIRRVCATMFKRDEGDDAITFVRKSLTHSATSRNPVSKAREQILYIIANMIPTIGNNINTYFDDIKAMCISVVRLEGTSDGAKAALAPLSALLSTGKFTAEEFQPNELFNIIIDALSSTSSVYHKQDGPKGAAFVFLGLIVATYPGAFEAKQVFDEVYLRLMTALRSIWKGNVVKLGDFLTADFEDDIDDLETAAPQTAASRVKGDMGSGKPNLIAGAISGLWQTLRTFPEILSLADKKRVVSAYYPSEEMFTYVLRAVMYACSRPGKRISLDVPEAGLTFLCEHFPFAIKAFAQHAIAVFDILHKCCHLKAKARVRALAGPALTAFLAALSGLLLRPDCGLNPKYIFNALVGDQLMRMLAGAATSSLLAASSSYSSGSGPVGTSAGRREAEAVVRYNPYVDSLLGIQCIGAFSTAIKQFMGAEDVMRIMSMLLDTIAVKVQNPDVESSAQDPTEEEEEEEGEGTDDVIEDKSRAAADKLLFRGQRAKVVLTANGVLTYSMLLACLKDQNIDDRAISQLQSFTTFLIHEYSFLYGGAHGGRSEVFKAVLSVLVSCILHSSAVVRHAANDILSALFRRTLEARALHNAAARTLFHPATGLSETRFVFEYIPLWSEMLKLDAPEAHAVLGNLLQAMHPRAIEELPVTQVEQTLRETIVSVALQETSRIVASANLSVTASAATARAIGLAEGEDASERVTICGATASLAFSLLGDDATDSHSVAGEEEASSNAPTLDAANLQDQYAMASLVDFFRYCLGPLFELPVWDRVASWLPDAIIACGDSSRKHPFIGAPYLLLTAMLPLFSDQAMQKTMRSGGTVEQYLQQFVDQALAQARYYPADVQLHICMLVISLPADTSEAFAALLYKATEACLTAGKATRLAYLGATGLAKLLQLCNSTIAEFDLEPFLSRLASILTFTSTGIAVAGGLNLATSEEAETQADADDLNNQVQSFASLRSKPRISLFSTSTSRANGDLFSAAACYAPFKAVSQLLHKPWHLLNLLDLDVTPSMLQRKVAAIIGSLNVEQIRLAALSTSGLRFHTQWATRDPHEKKLTVPLPIPGLHSSSAQLPVDGLLPLVIQLTTSATDRRTRITACEFFHSCSTLLVGRLWEDISAMAVLRSQVHTKTDTSTYKTAYFTTFKLCMPEILQLAVDSDTVIRKLFATLAQQLCRLLSSQPRFQESSLLHDALWAAAVQDTTVNRGFFVDCLNVFLEWSLRSTPAALDRSSASIAAAFMQRICAESRHSNSGNRDAAALIFNRIYRYFREHADLVDAYLLEIIEACILNLRLTELTISANTLGITAAAAALDHCTRIMEKYRASFNMPSTKRNPQAPTTLAELAAWLYTQRRERCKQTRRRVALLFEKVLVAMSPEKSGIEHAFRTWYIAIGSRGGAAYFGAQRYFDEDSMAVQFPDGRKSETLSKPLLDDFVASIGDAASLNSAEVVRIMEEAAWLVRNHLVEIEALMPTSSPSDRMAKRHRSMHADPDHSALPSTMLHIAQSLLSSDGVRAASVTQSSWNDLDISAFVAGIVFLDQAISSASDAFARQFVAAYRDLLEVSVQGLYMVLMSGKLLDSVTDEMDESGKFSSLCIKFLAAVKKSGLDCSAAIDALVGRTPELDCRQVVGTGAYDANRQIVTVCSRTIFTLHEAGLLQALLSRLSEKGSSSSSLSKRRRPGSEERMHLNPLSSKIDIYADELINQPDTESRLSAMLLVFCGQKLSTDTWRPEHCEPLVKLSLQIGCLWRTGPARDSSLAQLLGLEAGSSGASVEATRRLYYSFPSLFSAFFLRTATYVESDATSSSDVMLSTFPILSTLLPHFEKSAETTAKELVRAILANLVAEMDSPRPADTSRTGRISKKAFVVSLLCLASEMSRITDADDLFDTLLLVKVALCIRTVDPQIEESVDAASTPYFGRYTLPQTLRLSAQALRRLLISRYRVGSCTQDARWFSPATDLRGACSRLLNTTLFGCLPTAARPIDPLRYVRGEILSPSEMESTTLSALQQIADTLLPLRSRELLADQRSSRFTVARTFTLEMLALFRLSASPPMIFLCSRLLFEGDKHIFIEDIMATCSQLVEKLPQSGSSVISFIAALVVACTVAGPNEMEAISVFGGELRFAVNYNVVRQLVDLLLCPVLRRCDPATVKEVFISTEFFKIVRLLAATMFQSSEPCSVISDGPGVVRSLAPLSLLTYCMNNLTDFANGPARTKADHRQCSNAFMAGSLLREMFTVLDMGAVRSDLFVHYRSFLGTSGAFKDNQLILDLAKYGRDIIAGKPAAFSANVWQVEESQKEHLCTRQAVFSCLVAAARKSLTKGFETVVVNEVPDSQIYMNIVDLEDADTEQRDDLVFWAGGFPTLNKWDDRVQPAGAIQASTEIPQTTAMSVYPTAALTYSLEESSLDEPALISGAAEQSVPAYRACQTYFDRGRQAALDACAAAFDEIHHRNPVRGAEPPEWLKNILHKLRSTSSALSLRTFLLDLVLLRPEYFEDFSADITPPILQCLLDIQAKKKSKGDVKEGRAFSSFHPLLRKVCILLTATWHAESASSHAWTPSNRSDQELVKQFITYVIECSPDTTTRIRNENLTYVGTLIRRWSTGAFAARPNYRVVISFLTTQDTTSRMTLSSGGAKVAVALAVIFYLIEAGQPPVLDSDFSREVPGDVTKFYRVLASLWLPSKQRPLAIYMRVSELIGFLLAQGRDDAIMERQSHALLSLLPEVADSLAKLHLEVQNRSSNQTQERGFDRFLICLYYVAKNYPDILTRDLLNKTAQSLHMVRGRLSMRSRTLEHILRIFSLAVGSNPALVDEAWLYIQPHLPGLLRAQHSSKTRSSVIQTSSLAILHAMLKAGKYIILDEYFSETSPTYLPRIFARHPAEECRRTYYQLVIDAWDICRDTPPVSPTTRDAIGAALLAGFRDTDAAIRNRVISYFELVGGLSKNLVDRFAELCSKLTFPSPIHMSQWTHYAALLMLSLSWSTETEYRDVGSIFKTPIQAPGLGKPKFDDLPIDTSWATATFTVGAVQGGRYKRTIASISDFEQGGIIATQDTTSFSMTQGSQEAGRLISTLAPQINVGRRPAAAATTNSFATQSSTAAPDDASRRSIKTVAKDQGVRLRQYSTLNPMSLKEQSVAMRAQRRLQQKFSATLSRNYRVGEVPDIQIPLSAFIDPLASLSQGSGALAAAVVLLMFSVLADDWSPSASDTSSKHKAATTVLAPRASTPDEPAFGQHDPLTAGLFHLLKAVSGAVNKSGKNVLPDAGMATTINCALRLTAQAVNQRRDDILSLFYAAGCDKQVSELATYAMSASEATAVLETALLAGDGNAGLDGLPHINMDAPHRHVKHSLDPFHQNTTVLLNALYRFTGDNVTAAYLEQDLVAGADLHTRAVHYASLAKSAFADNDRRGYYEDAMHLAAVRAYTCLQNWTEVDKLLELSFHAGTTAPDTTPHNLAEGKRVLDPLRRSYALLSLLKRTVDDFDKDMGGGGGRADNEGDPLRAIQALAFPSTRASASTAGTCIGDMMTIKLPSLASGAAMLLNNFNKSRSLMEDGVGAITSLFSCIPEFSLTARESVLRELQPLTELRQCLGLFADLESPPPVLRNTPPSEYASSTFTAWGKKSLYVRDGGTDLGLHAMTVCLIRKIMSTRTVQSEAWTEFHDRTIIVSAVDSMERSMNAALFACWYEAGELSLARSAMFACTAVNKRRGQPMSAMQLQLALELLQASITKQNSLDKALRLHLQKLTTIRAAVDKLNSEKNLAKLIPSFADIIGAAKAQLDIDPEIAADSCVAQYTADHQLLLAEVLTSFAKFHLEHEDSTIEGPDSGAKKAGEIAHEAMQLLQASATGRLVVPVARSIRDPFAQLNINMAKVMVPGRDVMAQLCLASIKMVNFADEMLRGFEESDRAASDTGAALASMCTKLGGKNEIARLFASGVLQAIHCGQHNDFGTKPASVSLREGHECFDDLNDLRFTQRATRTYVATASLHIPRLVHLARTHDAVLEELLASIPSTGRRAGARKGAGTVTNVPSFAFLPWIPQLLASFGGSEETANPKLDEAILAILSDLACHYPQAVYYPLCMSSGRTPSMPPMTAREETLFGSLRAACATPLLDQFVHALEDLHNIELKSADWIKAVSTALSSATASGGSLSAPQVQLWIDDLQKRILNDWSSTRSRNVGSVVHSWQAAKRTQVLALFRENKITRESIAQASVLMGKVSQVDFSNIADLSDWLARYMPPEDRECSIEIPGQYDQYDGSKAPLLERHAKLVALQPHISTMASIRRPKRVVMLGDDQKSYTFLVKGGEDIRTDQRIQQVFRVANKFLARNSARNTPIRTYTVVPMTPYIGMIEWVPNTTTLKSVIEGAANRRREREQLAAVRPSAKKSDIWKVDNCPAADLRQDWLKHYGVLSSSTAIRDTYLKMNLKAGADELTEIWTNMMRTMSSGLLRDHLQSQSTSPDIFLTLRQNFMSTLYTFSAASYLIGLGDRHLDNWLLDTTDCTIVPIDFGAAFGYGTVALPVPELIPLRMGLQFFGVLQPLPALPMVVGELARNLDILCEAEAASALMVIMETFIWEPTVDWRMMALRKTNTGNALSSSERDIGSAGSDATVGHARGTVLITKLKLRKVHPTTIMQMLLLQNGNYAPTIRKALKVGSDADVRLHNMMATLRGTFGRKSLRADHPGTSELFLSTSDTATLEELVGGPLTNNEASRLSSALDVYGRQCNSATSLAECLVDMAADPIVLARQYAGLALWC